MRGRLIAVLLLSALCALPAGCGGPQQPTPVPTAVPLASEVMMVGWSEDQIATVLEAFTREYGVAVRYEYYDSQEQAIEDIRAGQVYDLVIVDNQFIPDMVAGGLLAEIDYRNVPNFKNVSPNFRNLVYDPENRHTIPYSWGSTGLLVRTDLVDEPVARWADLWDSRYAGRVATWSSSPRYTIGMALLSLGYSANTEDPAELEAALGRLLALKPHALWLSGDVESSAPLVVSGEAAIAVGWAYDMLLAEQESGAVEYVLPAEGTILWGDNFVIPANSPNKYTAELLLDFILRPEITAQIVNVDGYPMPNDAALPFVAPELLNNPMVYMDNEQMENAELLVPLSAEGQKLYDAIWQRFLAAQPEE